MVLFASTCKSTFCMTALFLTTLVSNSKVIVALLVLPLGVFKYHCIFSLPELPIFVLNLPNS